MLDMALEMGLTAAGKTAAKVGSKMVTTVAGCLIGYGISSVVIGEVRKDMDKYMKSEEFLNKSPEQQKKDINNYNVKAAVINGLCTSVGSVAAFFADTALAGAIDASGFGGSDIYIF